MAPVTEMGSGDRDGSGDRNSFTGEMGMPSL
jgi:hypothetical protein